MQVRARGPSEIFEDDKEAESAQADARKLIRESVQPPLCPRISPRQGGVAHLRGSQELSAGQSSLLRPRMCGSLEKNRDKELSRLRLGVSACSLSRLQLVATAPEVGIQETGSFRSEPPLCGQCCAQARRYTVCMGPRWGESRTLMRFRPSSGNGRWIV